MRNTAIKRLLDQFPDPLFHEYVHGIVDGKGNDMSIQQVNIRISSILVMNRLHQSGEDLAKARDEIRSYVRSLPLLALFRFTKNYPVKVPVMDLIREGELALGEAVDRGLENKPAFSSSFPVKGFYSSACNYIYEQMRLYAADHEPNLQMVNPLKFDEFTPPSCEEADKNLIHEGLAKTLNGLIEQKLPYRYQIIVQHAYGLNGLKERTLEEIGDQMGLTRERVRQLRERSVAILRECADNQILRQYLG